MSKKPVIVAITGATGVVYGVEMLRALRAAGETTHLIISESGARNFQIETDYSLDDVKALADVVHSNKDMAAAVSSGSFRTKGMIVAPCTIKTLSGIANSYDDDLVIRAADVCLKEGRKVLLMVRETPFHKGHLELMTKAADIGCIIMPPVPAFYQRPETILDMVRHTVGRTLDHFDIGHDLLKRWEGA